MKVERKRGKKKGKGKEGWKIAFWNVVGLGNKDKEFWKGLKEWDVMVLIETWVEEKGWNKIRRKLSEGYKWGMQGATKKGKRGRVVGGILMDIRSDLIEEGIEINVEDEGVLVKKIRRGSEKWRIIGVYVSKGMEVMSNSLEKEVDKREKELIVLGGGF